MIPFPASNLIYARIGAKLAPDAAAAMLRCLPQAERGQAAEMGIEPFGLGRREVHDIFAAYTEFLAAPAKV